MGKKKSAKTSALLAQMEKVGKLYGDLEPGVRKDVLGLVADLKTRWLALGQKLAEVKQDMEYLQWGHGTWEGYCEYELKMKATAADAMIHASLWMSDHHPEVLQMQSPKWLPDMRAVAALSTTEGKLIRDGWCDGERLDRLKEVEAQIMGGELDGPEARKAVAALTAKPKKEKSAPAAKAASKAAQQQQAFEDDIPLWQAMDAVNDHAHAGVTAIIEVLTDCIVPALGAHISAAKQALARLDPKADNPAAVKAALRYLDQAWGDWDELTRDVSGERRVWTPDNATNFGYALSDFLRVWEKWGGEIASIEHLAATEDKPTPKAKAKKPKQEEQQ